MRNKKINIIEKPRMTYIREKNKGFSLNFYIIKRFQLKFMNMMTENFIKKLIFIFVPHHTN